MSTEDEKEEALANLVSLIQICKSAMESLATLATSHSNTTSAPVDVLRKDALSLHRLIHNSTTRLSVSLGKPPPSYSIAKVPLKDLGSQVVQLTSCTCSFPPGVLRKEVVWAAEVTIRALETLVQHFEGQCRRDEFGGDEYLAKTGAIHDAVVKAEQVSNDETEAIVKVWKLNGESLDDSLREVREMMEKKDDVDKEDVGEHGEEGGDGWDEVGEGFGSALNPEEIKRVEKIYPLLRLTTELHGKLLSQHILKPPPSQLLPRPHLTYLLTYSNSLLLASDDLASSLYAPQDVESIEEAARLIYELTQDLDREVRVTERSDEKIVEELAGLRLGSGAQRERWFKECFKCIHTIYNNLSLSK